MDLLFNSEYTKLVNCSENIDKVFDALDSSPLSIDEKYLPFYNSVKKYYKDKGKLSDKQLNAIFRMYQFNESMKAAADSYIEDMGF